MIIKIAEFLIRIDFLNDSNIKNSNYFFSFKKTIKEGLKKFEITKKHERVKNLDYSIVFLPDNTYFNILSLSKKNIYKNIGYLKIFIDFTNEKKILTNYYISINQFNSILLYLLDKLMAKEGMILHCSGISYKKSAFLFSGKSGTGKSTVVRLLQHKFKPLCDDYGIIKLKNNKVFFYQMPFSDSFLKENKPFQVKKIFLLRKSNKYNIRKINKVKNIKHLLKNLILQNAFLDIKNVLSTKINILFNLLNKTDFYYMDVMPVKLDKKSNQIEKLLKLSS